MTNMRKRHVYPVITGKKAPKSALEMAILERYKQLHSCEPSASTSSDDVSDNRNFSNSGSAFLKRLMHDNRGFSNVNNVGNEKRRRLASSRGEVSAGSLPVMWHCEAENSENSRQRDDFLDNADKDKQLAWQSWLTQSHSRELGFGHDELYEDGLWGDCASGIQPGSGE